MQTSVVAESTVIARYLDKTYPDTLNARGVVRVSARRAHAERRREIWDAIRDGFGTVAKWLPADEEERLLF